MEENFIKCQYSQNLQTPTKAKISLFEDVFLSPFKKRFVLILDDSFDLKLSKILEHT